MLDTANNDNAVPATSGFARTFDGTNALEITSFDSITRNFLVQVVATHTSSGYYLAKSTAAGSRFYSLYYSSNSENLIFYYRTGGATSQVSVRWPVVLNDGNEHHIIFEVLGTTAELFVDGSSLGTRGLAGIVDDCGVRSSNCVMFVGQRSSSAGGAFRLTGEIADARLWYNRA